MTTTLMTPQGEEFPVRRARFTMALEFDAYVPAGSDDTLVVNRVSREVADAIEFHAPHILDFDPSGDALIALAGGPKGRGVVVSAAAITHLPNADPGAPEVLSALTRTAALAAECFCAAATAARLDAVLRAPAQG